MGVCACVGVRVCQSVRGRTPVAARYPVWGGLGSRERISSPVVEPRLAKPHCGLVEAILWPAGGGGEGVKALSTRTPRLRKKPKAGQGR